MKSLRTTEIVFIAVVGAAMGVFWWGYTLLYGVLSPFLKPWGIEGLLTGIWLMGGLFFPYIIRKPGSAMLGELVAAFVQGTITRWGLSSLVFGFWQALPVELFFMCMRYRRWNTLTMMGAGAASGLGSFGISYYYEKWHTFALSYQIIQCSVLVISGALLGGLLSKMLADTLRHTGVLNQFSIVHDHSTKTTQTSPQQTPPQ